MSQHDINIANQGFPAFRSDLNNALAALVSNSSGATAPTTTFAHQFWLDTSTTPNRLRQRNADNDAWIEVGRLDQVADTYQAAAVVDGVYITGNQTIAGTKTFSTAPVVPGLNGGQLAGMRNKLINGKMDISQRGTSFADANGYTLDRFDYLRLGGSASTITQENDRPSSLEFNKSLRIAVTTADTSIAAGDYGILGQKIEGWNARDLIGRTFTLSFWVRSTKTGTHCVAFRNSTNDRSYVVEYTVSATNTWEYKTITVSGGLITTGTWNWETGIGLQVHWALAAGTTFQTTAGAWQTGNFFATSNQVNCFDSNTNIFALTGVQLEVGSVATPFEHRPYGAELALCQRYLPAFNGATIVGAGWCSSATQAYVEVMHPVTTRVAPSGVTASAVSTFTIYGSGATGVTPTAITLNAGGTAGSRLSVTTASGLAAGIGTGLYANNPASSQLLFTGCEL